MEQQTPISPKSRMKPREGQKRAIFPSLIWGGGRLGFPFILSKIVGLLFGQAKRASRERASEAAPRGFAARSLARSRVLARPVSLAQTGELARRLPFVFRDSICQIRNACYIFNGGIILTTYNTRSLGYTRATTWATCLSTHNRTIPFRKANYSETHVNYLYGLTYDIDNTITSVLSANFV